MLADLLAPVLTSITAVVVALIGGVFALVASRRSKETDLTDLLTECMSTNRDLARELSSYRRSFDTGTLPAGPKDEA